MSSPKTKSHWNPCKHSSKTHGQDFNVNTQPGFECQKRQNPARILTRVHIYIYIYIYAVELKTGPIFAFSSDKNKNYK